jgi:uncharacterized protein (DUF2267 family)
MSVKSHTSRASRKAQARLAVTIRDCGTNHPTTREARAAFESERYLAAVQAAVASAPPLTPQQREQLRAILATTPVADLAEIGGATP